MNETSLKGRVVIVTGAGQGLGRCSAKKFAESGAIVVIAELDGGNARVVEAEIQADGGVAIAIHTDVASAASVQAMVDKVIETFGRIDVLVNNAAMAGVLGRRPFTEIPLDEWDAVMRVNVTGAFLCCRAVAPHMVRSKRGRIINMSSTTAVMGRVNMLHYVSSKAAIIGMTRSLARELGSHGITVNVVYPGLTPHETLPGLTEVGMNTIKAMQCIPRMETPDDVAGVILFLASDASRFVTGQSVVVDGGSVHI